MIPYRMNNLLTTFPYTKLAQEITRLAMLILLATLLLAGTPLVEQPVNRFAAPA